jgi:hypothetical protein
MLGIEEKKERRILLDDHQHEEMRERRNSLATNAEFYEDRPEQDIIFSEISREQDERVRKHSPFGMLKTWRLLKIIVKSNDDVR